MSLSLAPAAAKTALMLPAAPISKIVAAASVKDSPVSVIQSGDANVDKGPALKSLFDNAAPAPIERVWTKDELQSIIDWSLISTVRKYGINSAKVTFGIDNPDLPVLTLFVDRSKKIDEVKKAIQNAKTLIITQIGSKQLSYEYEGAEAGR